MNHYMKNIANHSFSLILFEIEASLMFNNKMQKPRRYLEIPKIGCLEYMEFTKAFHLCTTYQPTIYTHCHSNLLSPLGLWNHFFQVLSSTLFLCFNSNPSNIETLFSRYLVIPTFESQIWWSHFLLAFKAILSSYKTNDLSIETYYVVVSRDLNIQIKLLTTSHVLKNLLIILSKAS